MRTFIAITIPKETTATLAAAMKRLAPVAVDTAWRNVSKLHITLAFLGETSSTILPHLAVGLTRVCQTLPVLPCRVYGLGFFGNRRNPKAVWAGVDLSPALEALHEGVWQELKRFGIHKENVPYRPHVMLGRCKEHTRNQPLIEAMDADTDINFGAWAAPGITFYESRPSPKGVLYFVLNKFSLGEKGTP